jgi:hypothetical protein
LAHLHPGEFDFGDIAMRSEWHEEKFGQYHDIVGALAHGTSGDLETDVYATEHHDIHSLPMRAARVDPENVRRWQGGGSVSERVHSAMEGYRDNPSRMPPVLLVHRGGELLAAEGSHRLKAARRMGKPHVQAWIVQSPEESRYPGEED